MHRQADRRSAGGLNGGQIQALVGLFHQQVDHIEGDQGQIYRLVVIDKRFIIRIRIR